VFLYPRLYAFGTEVDLAGLTSLRVPDHCHTNGANKVILHWRTNLALWRQLKVDVLYRFKLASAEVCN